MILPLNICQGQTTIKPFNNSQFFKTDGLIIHYQYWPPKTDSLKGSVLFIHGFCGSTFCWHKTIDSLCSSGYEILALDVPPYGYSDRNLKQNQSPTYRAGLIHSLLQEKFPEKKWHVTGHSMGGSIAEAFALKHPEKTKSLILVAALMFSKTTTTDNQVSVLFKLPPLQSFLAVIAEEFLITPNQVGNMLRSAYASEPDSASIYGYYKPLTKESTARAILAAVNSYETDILNIKTLKMPVLAIWGDKDKWVPLSISKPVLKKIEGHQLHIIEGAGHCPMETHPKNFLSIFLPFIQENQ